MEEGKETWAKLLSNCFHKGEEAVICTECIWRKRGGALVHLVMAKRVGLRKQMECQPLRKINEAAIGAN